MQGCDITSGLAGGGTTPDVTCGWKSAIDAIVRYMSERHRATTGQRSPV